MLICVKDDDARLERQRTIEQAVLQKANSTADRKVNELISQDPVRSEACPSISYFDSYKKGWQYIEKRLDQETDRREKERLRLAVRAKEDEIEKKQFDNMKKNIEENREAAPAPVQARNEVGDRIRDPISLAALDLAAPKKRLAANQNVQQQNPQQNQHQNLQQQNQPGRSRRGSI